MVVGLYGRNRTETKMKIEIKSCHLPTLQALLEGEKPDGITVQLVPPRFQADRSIDWLTLTISVAANVPVGLVVNWLSKYLFGADKTTKIIANSKEIYFDKGEVTRLIEETKIIEHVGNDKE